MIQLIFGFDIPYLAVVLRTNYASLFIDSMFKTLYKVLKADIKVRNHSIYVFSYILVIFPDSNCGIIAYNSLS